MVEIGDEFLRDFELSGNSDCPYSDKVGPTCTYNVVSAEVLMLELPFGTGNGVRSAKVEFQAHIFVHKKPLPQRCLFDTLTGIKNSQNVSGRVN